MTQGLTSPVKKFRLRTSLVVQWLRHCTPDARDTGLIPAQGTRIPHAAQHGEKEKKKNQQICGRKGEREERREGGRIDTVPRGLAGVAGHEFSSFSQVVPCQ